jgi:hypothetical protein
MDVYLIAGNGLLIFVARWCPMSLIFNPVGIEKKFDSCFWGRG